MVDVIWSKTILKTQREASTAILCVHAMCGLIVLGQFLRCMENQTVERPQNSAMLYKRLTRAVQYPHHNMPAKNNSG